MSKPFVCWPVSLQIPGRKLIDPTRTALTTAAYIARTRFTGGDPDTVDFTMRGADLVARIRIQGEDAPDWVRKPYLRWVRADEASERTGNPKDIRCWHVVADLPPLASEGEWIDRAKELVTLALTPTAVADVAIHNPDDGPPHAHVVVASRIPGDQSYLGVDYDIYRALTLSLRAVWDEWLQECGDHQGIRHAA